MTEVAKEQEKDFYRSDRLKRLSSIQGKERPLALAGTMSLNNRPLSPLSKLKETRGMVTVKRVQDINEQKIALAQKEYTKLNGKYVPPKEHQFRNFDTLGFNQKDFVLQAKPPVMNNPNGLSEHNKQPKYHFEKQ